LDPHACFLLHRGLTTLCVRVKHQNSSALKIAGFLDNHPGVNNVNYPGLDSNTAFKRASRLFDGFGGMLSFELKGSKEDAAHFIQNTTLPVIAPSLGGIETLLTQPALTSHSSLAPEEREKQGISDSLIRVSVGIEATEDIIADFENAIQKAL
jgi:cystathionine beta-lyase/cystathionine gamma-synthase